MRVRRQVGAASRSLLSKAIAPLETLRMPMTLFMSVVLPAPLRPISPAMLPVGSSSDTRRRTCTERIETSIWSILSTRPALRFVDAVQLAADDEALHLGVVQHGPGRPVRDDASVVEGEHAPGEA